MTREELFRAVGEVREDQIMGAAERTNRTAPCCATSGCALC